MRISISYSVPVQVIVDLDTGTVDRVVVIDEDITADRNGFAENADTYTPATPEQITAAYDIAEGVDTGAVEWPAWDMGW